MARRWTILLQNSSTPPLHYSMIAKLENLGQSWIGYRILKLVQVGCAKQHPTADDLSQTIKYGRCHV